MFNPIAYQNVDVKSDGSQIKHVNIFVSTNASFVYLFNMEYMLLDNAYLKDPNESLNMAFEVIYLLFVILNYLLAILINVG